MWVYVSLWFMIDLWFYFYCSNNDNMDQTTKLAYFQNIRPFLSEVEYDEHGKLVGAKALLLTYMLSKVEEVRYLNNKKMK